MLSTRKLLIKKADTATKHSFSNVHQASPNEKNVVSHFEQTLQCHILQKPRCDNCFTIFFCFIRFLVLHFSALSSGKNHDDLQINMAQKIQPKMVEL